MKFGKKIFIYIFFSTAFIILGLFLITHLWVIKHHMLESIRSAKELARIASLKSQDYVLRNEIVELHRFYQSITGTNPYIDYIFAVDDEEILVHTYEKGVPRGLLKLNPPATRDEINITPFKSTAGNLFYLISIGIGDPSYAELYFVLSHNKIMSDLKHHRDLMIGVGIVLLATIPFSLAFFLSRFVSRPVYKMRKGVKRIGSGDLSFRMDMKAGDEIDQLVNDINLMAENLEQVKTGLEEEITERHNVEMSLARQKELLDNILNNVPLSIFWKDRHSVYMGCNSTFAKIAELKTQEDIIGKTDYDLPWKKEESDFYRETDERVINTGSPVLDLEEKISLNDGEERTVVTSKVPLRGQKGNVFGVLGIYYDITEKRQIEEALKQKQKMEAIGTLAGGIAHDFNNILGIIIGYAELIMTGMEDDNPSSQDMQQILDSALRAKDLVRQILTFGRKSKEERKPVQLSSILREETKLLRSILPATIEIRENINNDKGIIYADATQMHQVIINLCTNAAYAMEGKGGVLEINLSALEVTQNTVKRYNDISPGPFLKLEINDSGTGIDPRVLHRIFEPFYTTKMNGEGTGMGLAVVHGIVKSHGGDIIVESSPGKGTTFTVLLPEIVSGHIDEELPVEISMGKGRVLVVDDEINLLKLEERMLNSLGYRVTPVNSSIEALRIYQNSPENFDLVLTDHTMPHMTGYQLSLKVLEINPSVPIILCTGYSDSITNEKVESAGIKALLYKPVKRNELASKIVEILDRKKINRKD
ncbi:MAG: ATP-binding protein [Desulfobacteraceae bacterium]|jgi:PAS domain S-box-containing protein